MEKVKEVTLEQRKQIVNKEQFEQRIKDIVEYSNSNKYSNSIEIFSEGKNAKLCRTVSILNLPAIVTCTNCATCAKSCYATLRGDTPTVQKRWDRNLAMTMRDDFVELATRELQYKQTQIVRFHESGDFYSEQYIDKCMELAIANPHIEFYGYTKNKSALRLNILSNVNIIYSLIETKAGEVRNYGTEEYCKVLEKEYGAFICPHTNEWKEQGKSCMGTCKECLTRDKVSFVIHGRSKNTDKYSDVMIDKIK